MTEAQWLRLPKLEKAVNFVVQKTREREQRSIHDQRAWEGMPILADALAEAGRTSEIILSHCRGTSQHVRGCWVVDRILEYR